MQVCVFGLGISGFWAARLALASGFNVTVVDEKPRKELQEKIGGLDGANVEFYFGGDFPEKHFDLMVTSPGVSWDHPFVKRAAGNGTEVVGEVEFSYRFAPFEVAKKGIAVTGTNGKTTVTEMISHILRKHGYTVFTGGNYGIPLSKYMLDEDPKDFLVLELSSFQISQLVKCKFRGGVLLNISQDHIDVHGSFEAYMKAKLGLREHVLEFFVANMDCKWSRNIEGALFFSEREKAFCFVDGDKVVVNGRKVCSLKELLPRHRLNLSNILASLSVCTVLGMDAKEVLECLTDFSYPKHRLELVVERDGVSFYDDSKATNPHAVVRALRAFAGNVVLIMGGQDKGMDFSMLKDEVRSKVRLLVLYGEAADKIERQLGECSEVVSFKSFDDAVEFATESARVGDVVLLSPGCSSFDQFSSYAERGNRFRELVLKI